MIHFSDIELRSDNAAGVAPEIFEAVSMANSGSALAYGADDWTDRLQSVVRRVFECDGAHVFPVVSGTAANALGLTALCPPWGAVMCHESAHILQSECGATSMLGGGAVMRGVPGDDFRLQPHTLTEALDAVRWGDPHHAQPAVVSLTCPSDMGTVYSLDDVRTLADLAHERGLRVHLDGARIANAIVALGCSAADLTTKAGIDMLTLGATKNGALSTDAIVSFDADASAELVYRTKRSGHVASKMRFQSVQIERYLTDGLWLDLAGRSNATMARLSAGLRELGVDLVNRPDANMVFADIADDVAGKLEAAGLLFYRIRPGVVRFVTSFQTTDDEIDSALDRIGAALSP